PSGRATASSACTTSCSAPRSRPSRLAAILTRIDHVTIGVADLAAGIDAYTRIGFDLDARGVAWNDGDHLEFVRGGDGLKSVALASDNLSADAARGSADYVRLVEAKGVSKALRHPNGVQRIERVYIAVTNLAAAVEKYSDVLGMRAKMERGTVINADMAIF